MEIVAWPTREATYIRVQATIVDDPKNEADMMTGIPTFKQIHTSDTSQPSKMLELLTKRG